MRINVKAMLEETGLKVAENCFLKPPALPYIVFLENSNFSGADNKICLLKRDITVELYNSKINREKEKEVEEILIKNSIEFSKERTWIDSEKIFQTVYDFNLYEKK
ncbi:MAG: hypothetical protein E7D69_15200 [Clostridium celatum]|nr:hypothetical protein [Clostridium celatum]